MAKTARQIAAAKRNIVKAQAASARSRKGKSRSKQTGHHYGTGRQGRRATKRALYGSRRHGISPTQAVRRKGRYKKTKIVAKNVAAAAVVGAVAYANLSPMQRSRLKSDYGHVKAQARNTARGTRGTYYVNRQMGVNRRKSAGAAAKFARTLKPQRRY